MKKETRVKTIIFDLGNVLIDFDYTKAIKRLTAYSPLSGKEMLSRLSRSRARTMHEKGAISDIEFFKKTKKDLNLDIGRGVFEKLWSDIFRRNMAMEKLMLRLKRKGYKIALLSDTSPIHHKHELRNFRITKLAHRYFPSFRLKARKAEGRRIFDIVLKKLKARPAETLFIDDLPANVRFAKKTGIKAVLFKDIRMLKAKLKKEGVMI